jgi:hypothetical protein
MRGEALRAIIQSKEEDLRTLAQIAGGHPASFYRGANFDDTDLRGEDLRGFNLQAATFRHARVDRHTKVNPEFVKEAGLERTLRVRVEIYDLILDGLANCGIVLEKPTADHLGDILEDALFGPMAAPTPPRLKRWISTTGPIGSNNSKKLHIVSTGDLFVNSNKTAIIASEGWEKRVTPTTFLNLGSNSILKFAGDAKRRYGSANASLSQRTGEEVIRLKRRTKQGESDICTMALLSYTLFNAPSGKPPKWWHEMKGSIATST